MLAGLRSVVIAAEALLASLLKDLKIGDRFRVENVDFCYSFVAALLLVTSSLRCF